MSPKQRNRRVNPIAPHLRLEVGRKDAANLLGISTKTLDRKRKKRELAPPCSDKPLRWKVADLSGSAKTGDDKSQPKRENQDLEHSPWKFVK